MATNTSQDVGRSGSGHIANRTRRVIFKTHHMPLSSIMCPLKESFYLAYYLFQLKQRQDGFLQATPVPEPVSKRN
ncbi:hypothetical protein TNCV_281091 [Trichonephila clavipes]|nr:hypothetical protein TNCV_281091 [Trichonephila clavipes]